MSPDERAAYRRQTQEAAARKEHGPLNPSLICPHCHQQGIVRTEPTNRKKGISGGKATAAVLTGGVSMLATGLSARNPSRVLNACIAIMDGTFNRQRLSALQYFSDK